MKQKDVILYASLAGGAYLAYWYMTNYGPGGSASQGHPSYWDTWFGGAQQQVAPVGTMPSGLPATTGGVPAVIIQPPIVTTTAPNPSQTLRDKMVAASGNAPQLNAHQWNYYRNQIAPPAWTGEQMSSAFPGDAAAQLMTVDQFLAAAHSVGLSGIGAIVPARSMASIPSMTFGGSMKSNLMGGMMQSNMKGPVN